MSLRFVIFELLGCCCVILCLIVCGVWLVFDVFDVLGLLCFCVLGMFDIFGLFWAFRDLVFVVYVYVHFENTK